MKKYKILINDTVLASLSPMEMQELNLLKGMLPKEKENLTDEEELNCKNYNDYLEALSKKRGSKDVDIIGKYYSIEMPVIQQSQEIDSPITQS